MMKGEERSAAVRKLGRAAPTRGELQLLRAAVLPKDRAAHAWRAWISTGDIDTVHNRSTDLLPAVAANLPSEVLGDEAGRARGLRRRVWADNQFGFGTLANAIDLLVEAGIDPIVAKGAALATTVYPHPGTRPMSDVDLIVAPERIDEACAALLDAGWTRVDTVEGPFFHAVALADSRGRSVDLHRWVAFPRFTPVPERSWLGRTEPHDVKGRSVRRLASSDELLLSVLHGLLTNSDSSSRWPLDVVHLCRAGIADPGFWTAVVDAARELRVGPVVADALAMCAVELETPVPDRALAELAAQPVDRLLALHWRLCRSGVTPEWRIARYRRLARSEGRRPSIIGYLRPRWRAIRARGLRSAVATRLARARSIVDVRTRT